MIFIKEVKKKILNQKELIFLIVLLIIGGFLRFYRLEDLMTYLGDEGRDMLIVMDILQGKNFPLIGPPTSIGHLYLGPIYYYFVAPFAWIFKMNPVGPAVFVALLGILTIFLIYLTGKIFFGSIAGFFSATLYTFSPLIVKFSRSSWNPNPMPFFSLLVMLGLFYWQKTKKSKYLYLSIFSFSVMLQLHYLVILLIPFLIFVLFKLGNHFRNKKPFFYAFLIFALLLSPLIVFDLKHGFVNTKGILGVVKEGSGGSFNLIDLLSRARDRVRQLFSLFFDFSERDWRTNLTVGGVLILSFLDWLNQKRSTRLIVYGWFLWGILAIGLYRLSVYPHYLGFLFVFPSLLLGNALSIVFKKGALGKLLSLILLILFSLNMIRTTWTYLSHPPVLNVKLVKKIVRLIEKESRGEPFNFALLAKNNYDSSYRFFFKLWQIPAVYETEVADQLFVICEDEEICQPEGNPKWEIALFDAAYDGQIKRSGFWQPDFSIKIFRFIPEEDKTL